MSRSFLNSGTLIVNNYGSCTILQCTEKRGLEHRVYIFARDEHDYCICPLSWSVHCNFTGDGKCSERGWACTTHPHQPGLLLPS
jgi:hypothetical protein